MAAPAAPKEQLRLFAKIGGSAGDEARGKSAPGPGAAVPPPTTAGSWGLHALATTRHDFPATSLLLGVLAGPSAAAPLRPFDRSSGGDGNRGDQEGALAAALARQLLPGGWALLSLRLARWQARLAVESPCGGVPGLSASSRGEPPGCGRSCGRRLSRSSAGGPSCLVPLIEREGRAEGPRWGGG